MTPAIRIRQARQARRISQRTLAELCGLASPSLSSIERGKTNPRLDSIAALCRALNVSADFIIFGEKRA